MITLWGRNNSTNVKKVLLTLEELELPYEQILAGREFGINHDADFLAMNPNGLVPLLRDDEVISFFGIKRHCPLSGGTVRAKTPVDRLTGTSCGSGKMDGLGKPDAQ